MAYTGTTEIISGLIQKNGGKFPLAPASGVYMSDSKMLSDVMRGLEDVVLVDYINEKAGNASQVTSEFGERINALEKAVGTNASEIGDVGGLTNTLSFRVAALEQSVGNVATSSDSLNSRMTTVENALGDNSSSDRTVSERVSTIEQTLGIVQSAGEQTGETARNLVQRVSEVESRVSTETNDRANADSNITERINTVTTALGNEASGTGVLGRVKALENSVSGSTSQITDTVNGVVNPIATELRNADSQLISRVSTLEQFVGSNEAATSSLAGKVANNTSRISETQTTLGELAQRVNSMNSSFVVVNSTDEMTDHNALYINTADNKWYYYNENTSGFIPGGNIVGINIDQTLTQQYQAADAKTVGIKIASLEERASALESVTEVLHAVSNSEFMDIKTDSNNKILEGTFYDGRKYYANDVVAPNISYLEEKMAYVLKQLEYLS